MSENNALNNLLEQLQSEDITIRERAFKNITSVIEQGYVEYYHEDKKMVNNLLNPDPKDELLLFLKSFKSMFMDKIHEICDNDNNMAEYYLALIAKKVAKLNEEMVQMQENKAYSKEFAKRQLSNFLSDVISNIRKGKSSSDFQMGQESSEIIFTQRLPGDDVGYPDAFPSSQIGNSEGSEPNILMPPNDGTAPGYEIPKERGSNINE